MSRYIEVSYIKPNKVIPAQNDFVSKEVEYRRKIEIHLNEIGYLPAKDISPILRANHISVNYNCFPRSFHTAGYCFYDVSDRYPGSLFINSAGHTVLFFTKLASTIFERNEVFIGCSDKGIKSEIFKGISGLQKLKREANRCIEKYSNTGTLSVVADKVNHLQDSVIERMLNKMRTFHPEDASLTEVYENGVKQVYMFEDANASFVKLFWELVTIHDTSSISVISVRKVKISIEHEIVAKRVREEFKSEFEELEKLRSKIEKIEALQKLKG